MKFLVVFVVLVGVVSAKPGRERQTEFQNSGAEAPYPAAGFRPAGQQFYLPARQTQQQEGLVPRAIYGPPSTEEAPTTTDSTTTEEPTTTLRPFSSQLNEAKVLNPTEEEHETEEPLEDKATETPDEENIENDDEDEVEEIEDPHVQQQPPQPTGQEGVYYVLLQNGQLQKVQYVSTLNNLRNMAYSTQLRYENVEPISGPIYTFTPGNQLNQVFFE